MKKSLPKGDRDMDPEDMDDDDSSIPDDFDASEDDLLDDGSEDDLRLGDEEAGLGSDEEDAVPLELSDLDDDEGEASESGDDAWGGVSGVKRKKGASDEAKDAGSKKKKRKVALPTFASYDDYAKMIDAAGDDGEDK